MFVYLLIAAELAVLYTAFWYLYAREPKQERRIKGRMWGTYEDSPAALKADQSLSFLRHQDAYPTYGETSQIDTGEYVLDLTTNHYIRVQAGRKLLDRMAQTLDSTFSNLNVKQ